MTHGSIAVATSQDLRAAVERATGDARSRGVVRCGLDVQTLETATIADLKKVVEHALVQRLKEEERVLISCRPNSREGVGEPNAMHIECARWDKLIKEGMVPKEFLEDYRRAKYGYAGLITLEKSDLQLYEGGRVSAVNKSGAVNPQLMKPKFH
ncbi:hypothetical protein Scep_029473 [Stephania cephalantha]|uniref:Uncharacterized protein n=1 Tax=Stephania cephalantha TaxID=152367 RepID=A0AAP0E1B1_9MAGN